MGKKNYSYKDLSERLGFPIGTLRTWVMQGRLEPVKHGSSVKFREEYVERIEKEGVPSLKKVMDKKDNGNFQEIQ